jgi:hypothetical protein
MVRVTLVALLALVGLFGHFNDERNELSELGIGVARISLPHKGFGTMLWYDLAGSVGVLLIVVAFLLLQLERVASNSLSYLIANAIGAALILLSLLYEFNLSAFLMEAFWLAISLLGLARRQSRS